MPYCCQEVVEVQAPLIPQESTSYHLVGMKVPLPFLTFFDTTLAGVLGIGFVASFQGQKSKTPLGLCWQEWRWNHSFFEQLLSKSFVLLCCLFPGPLARENRLFWGLFFVTIDISGFLASQYPVWDICGKKKTQDSHHQVVPPIIRAACFSPYFKVLMFDLKCTEFLVVLSGRNRKCMSTWSFCGSLNLQTIKNLKDV